MAPLPEEDVPTLIGTPSAGDGDGDDDTTTAEAGPPLRSRPPPLPSSRPLRPSQPPETIASSMPPPRTQPGPIASTVPVAAGSERELTDLDLEEDDDEPDDSITTMAPRVSVSSIAGLAVPAKVEIRTIHGDDDEELDETEVRTRPGNMALEIPVGLRSPRPAAGVPASAAPPPDTEQEDDDGVTAQAVAPRVPTMPELAALGIISRVPSTDRDTDREAPSSEVLTRPSIEPETRPGLPDPPEPETRPGLGLEPETRPGHASLGDDESPTARGLVPEPYADEGDSVTTQAPAFPEALIAAAVAPPKTVHDATLEDLTEGTTKKLRHPRKKAESRAADSESESITTQAPAPLTDMLRVLAADDDGTPENGVAAVEEDELPENRTAVMANAPLQRTVADLSSGSAAAGSTTASLPPIRPTGPGLGLPHASSAARAAAAPQLSPASESGLRVTRQHEHASAGVLGVADARPSGISRSAPQPAVDGRPFAQTEAAFPAQPPPSLHDAEPGKGPRYGLVVAIVAAVSFVVPVTLFVVLRAQPEAAAVGGTPSELTPEVQQREGAARGKLDRKAAAAAASASAAAAASASASASAAASAHGSKPPHRR